MPRCGGRTAHMQPVKRETLRLGADLRRSWLKTAFIESQVSETGETQRPRRVIARPPRPASIAVAEAGITAWVSGELRVATVASTGAADLTGYISDRFGLEHDHIHTSYGSHVRQQPDKINVSDTWSLANRDVAGSPIRHRNLDHPVRQHVLAVKLDWLKPFPHRALAQRPDNPRSGSPRRSTTHATI